MGRSHWPSVAVVGAGAVGGYFGGLLADAGAPVTMIGRQRFVDAVKSHGLVLDTLHFRNRVHLEATTNLDRVRCADLILLCVKTTDTTATAIELAPCLSPHATVVSLQNGVDNVERIRAAASIDALPAAVYVAASVPEPGHVKHVSRGDLVVGPDSGRTKEVARVFERAGIPCRISENIEGELWVKLFWNCALNAVSALGQARYGRIKEDATARALIQVIVDEVLAVARAAQITLPGLDGREAAFAGAMRIATEMAQAFSSTAQDINRGKRTEIDSLNGYVARRGEQLGVPTPVNRALCTLVKLLEDR